MEETKSPAELGNISRKISSIAAGEAHTLALTDDRKVYSWGRGTFGVLGTGSEEDRHFPVRVSFFGSDDERDEQLKIVAIAAGAYRSLALADDGSVWGWGYRIYGQTDFPGEKYLIPRLLECFTGLGSPGNSLKISSIQAGGMMSLAIDNDGALWMWGNCPHPSESKSVEEEFSLVSTAFPISMWNFQGHTVVNVACGNEHVVALVCAASYEASDLICYSWGGNTHGQLGLGDKESRLNPQVIRISTAESSWGIYEIACGAFHTALLAERKRPSYKSESGCWTFGLGDNGQLGHGTTQSLSTPELVRGLPESTVLVLVDCGLFHTSVVSSVGEVWSWGMDGGLGLCPDARFIGADLGDALSPLAFTANGLHNHRFQNPLRIACGAAHTILVADAGSRLWCWGRGRNGVLGNGKTADCYAPTLVLWPLLDDDFKEEESSNTRPNDNSQESKNAKVSGETERRLSAVMEEMKLLQSKLSMMERYASILHSAIFGRPLHVHEISASLQNSSGFDLTKEWEIMLDSSDTSKLIRLERFYSDKFASVKDKLMKRKIQEIVREYLRSIVT